MKDTSTRCFITACLLIAVTALCVKAHNLYSDDPLQKALLATTAMHDKKVDILHKRLQYAKTCIMEEKELDNIHGQAYYNCEKIAAQVYPFPDELKKI